MRKSSVLVLLLILALGSASAAKKDAGTTTLKDLQPAGTPDKKQKQQYDLTFVSQNNQYTCRTHEGKKVDATQWVVGSQITYQVQGNKGKVKNSAGKEVPCTIVRVAAAQ